MGRLPRAGHPLRGRPLPRPALTGWTLRCLLVADALTQEQQWEAERLLTVRGFAPVGETGWSAGPGDDLTLEVRRRRDLHLEGDRARFDEAVLSLTSAAQGAAWRFLGRDAVGLAAALHAVYAVVLPDDVEADVAVHRPVMSGELPAVVGALTAVPTSGPLDAALAATGDVTHEHGFTVRRLHHDPTRVTAAEVALASRVLR